MSLGDWAHLGNYIYYMTIYDILLGVAPIKSQHICGRIKRDWRKFHDCFFLNHIMNHRSQAVWWWSNMWANIDKKKGYEVAAWGLSFEQIPQAGCGQIRTWESQIGWGSTSGIVGDLKLKYIWHNILQKWPHEKKRWCREVLNFKNYRPHSHCQSCNICNWQLGSY